LVNSVNQRWQIGEVIILKRTIPEIPLADGTSNPLNKKFHLNISFKSATSPVSS